MSATLKVTHKAIGAEVRRGPYDIEVDGKRFGSVNMNGTFDASVEPGSHTLKVRKGRRRHVASLERQGDGSRGQAFEIVVHTCGDCRTQDLE